MIGIGFDKLPDFVFTLGLSKNELAKLASIDKIPNDMIVSDKTKSKDDVLTEIKKKLSNNKLKEAWQMVLYLNI